MSQGDQPPPTERDEWRNFENLLLELSARFINVTPEKLDDEILEAQRRMCECLGLDRSSLWQRLKGDSDEATMTHRHGSFGPPLPQFPKRSKSYFPWVFDRVFEYGEILAVPSLSAEASRDAETFRHHGTEATVVVPLAVAGGPIRGAISFASRTTREWPEVLLKRFRMIAHIFANALARRDSELKLKKSYEELCLLREQVEQENVYLKVRVKKEPGLESIVGESPAIMKTLSQTKKVASVSSTVLVFGETGTGKELIAQAIHDMSPRSRRPLMKVNCAGTDFRRAL